MNKLVQTLGKITVLRNVIVSYVTNSKIFHEHVSIRAKFNRKI
jgi:hypothetical protein